MKRYILPSFQGTFPRRGLLLVLAGTVLFFSAMVSSQAKADPLEVSGAVTPSFVQDKSYEAFSSDRLSLVRVGADVRAGVGQVDGFEFLPLLSYRYGSDEGKVRLALDNDLVTHDILLGLRVRKGLLTWLSVFAEVSGGLLLAEIDSRITTSDGVDYTGGGSSGSSYHDQENTWTVGGLAGVELHLSKPWLESRGVDGFNFGGEVGIGYTRRGDLSIRPSLEGRDKNAIPLADEPSWGDVNLSCWFIQIGIEFRFF